MLPIAIDIITWMRLKPARADLRRTEAQQGERVGEEEEERGTFMERQVKRTKAPPGRGG
jgi:hypothetical protein